MDSTSSSSACTFRLSPASNLFRTVERLVSPRPLSSHNRRQHINYSTTLSSRPLARLQYGVRCCMIRRHYYAYIRSSSPRQAATAAFPVASMAITASPTPATTCICVAQLGGISGMWTGRSGVREPTVSLRPAVGRRHEETNLSFRATYSNQPQ